MIAGWLWIVFTVTAAFFQTLRNAMQRELTTSLGTVGATHVRFLFGFPFSVIFLLIVMLATGAALPVPTLSYWPWLALGAFGQIAATALMPRMPAPDDLVAIHIDVPRIGKSPNVNRIAAVAERCSARSVSVAAWMVRG